MIKLFNGDCFKKINTIEPDVFFTSPPYNRKRNDKYTNYDDSIDNYYGFLVEITEKMLHQCREFAVVNLQANYYNKVDVYRFIGHFADKIKQTVIWEKTNPLPANGNNITNSYEYFFILSDKSVKSNSTYTKNHISTSVNSETTTRTHRAVMKQEVADWFMEKFVKEGWTVCDPFMGLGTTGISCVKNGLDFIGIEMNEEYFNEAKERINKQL